MRGSNAEAAKAGLAFLKHVARDTRELRQPPEIPTASNTENVLPFSVVRGTRSYLEATTHQINGSYENGWYDACAVMMRKLIETLIIEVYEQRRMTAKIQTADGNFQSLESLIGKVIGDSAWNVSRATKKGLYDVKELGDSSAHGRRFAAHRGDIDDLRGGFRAAVQELVQLSGLS